MRSTERSPEEPPGGDLLLRPAQLEDAAAVAEVYLAARKAAVPLMPAPVHSDDEVRAWLAERVGDRAGETWVAEVQGRVIGYARLTDRWLDDLYVAPGCTGRGIGSALLQLVTSLRPAGFSLWVFECNEPARRFYRRFGLFEVERTDGRDNEEQAPDIQMSWPGGSAAST